MATLPGRVIVTSFDHLPRLGQFFDELGRLGPQGFLSRYAAPALLFSPEGAPIAADEFATIRTGPDAVRASLAKTAVAWVAKRVPDRCGSCVFVGRLPVYDLVLPFAGISKLHAGILRRPDGTWAIGDQRSKNGTFLGGVQVRPGAPVPLTSGDTLRFGTLEALFLTPAGFRDEVARIRNAVAALRSA